MQISEFKTRFEKGDLSKVFALEELSQNEKAESLAGVFAAKEAFFKAIGKKEDWLDVWIEKDKTGKPSLGTTLLEPSQKATVSISHAGDYAVAIVIIEEI